MVHRLGRYSKISCQDAASDNGMANWRRPRAEQQDSFRAHIAAARETGLPLLVHTRDADGDTASMLAEEHAKGPFRGLIHCFSSSQQLADKAIELGLYISFSGILTFKK